MAHIYTADHIDVHRDINSTQIITKPVWTAIFSSAIKWTVRSCNVCVVYKSYSAKSGELVNLGWGKQHPRKMLRKKRPFLIWRYFNNGPYFA
jgi:hypothetical protein